MPQFLSQELFAGDGHYIVSEANGYLSRDTGIIASGAGVLKPGTVLGQVTATKKWKPVNFAATDGTETAGAILYQGCDATSADVERTLTRRASEVQAVRLTWPSGATANQISAALATLAEADIISR